MGWKAHEKRRSVRGVVTPSGKGGKKLGDSHSFGPNDWILFDEAGQRSVQSAASRVVHSHAYSPL